jgi:hypothetical protein
MARHPEILLTSLDWQRDGIESAGEQPQAAASAGKHESGNLRGEIRPFRGDYRSAMNSVQAFAGLLRHDAEVESVTVTQLPLNARSSSVLSGNTLDALTAGEMRAEFGIHLTLAKPKTKERP